MLASRLLSRLQQKKAQLDALRPLPQASVRRLNEQLAVEWIYNSNAIEGNTLTLRETRLILETGLTIGGKMLREHFEVINHKRAIEYVESLLNDEAPLTPFHVRQIHYLVLEKIDDDNAGQYRNVSVRIAGATHTRAAGRNNYDSGRCASDQSRLVTKRLRRNAARRRHGQVDSVV